MRLAELRSPAPTLDAAGDDPDGAPWRRPFVGSDPAHGTDVDDNVIIAQGEPTWDAALRGVRGEPLTPGPLP